MRVFVNYILYPLFGLAMVLLYGWCRTLPEAPSATPVIAGEEKRSSIEDRYMKDGKYMDAPVEWRSSFQGPILKPPPPPAPRSYSDYSSGSGSSFSSGSGSSFSSGSGSSFSSGSGFGK